MSDVTRRRLLELSGTAIATSAGVVGFSGSAAADNLSDDMPVVSTAGLDVREAPETDFEAIADIEQGTGGEIQVGPVENDRNTWWKVSWNQDDDEGTVTGWSREGDGRIEGPTDFAYPCPGWISQGYKPSHQALDIANERGTDIMAGAAGTVSATTIGPRCGLYVMLDHGDGWRTIHCHLSDFTVSEGEDVERGEKIAEMGTTGVSTGPHLHWSIDQNGERKRIPFTEDYDVLRGAGVPRDYGL